jgi:haloalkane dehalogenase
LNDAAGNLEVRSQKLEVDTTAYPFAAKFVQLSAGRMHYVDEGTGPTMLLVHGTPTWSFEYRHLIREFSTRFRVVAPDHLGFGLSDRPPAFPYTPEAHAAALDEFVTALNLDHILLVVHDFGGPIGLPLALSRPSRVTRVVVLNSWMWPFDDDPNMTKKARLAGGALGRWMYKHLNFSLKVLMPSVYGNRKALTPAIHRQYLAVFSNKDDRVLVLHALARALLGSRAFYADLRQRADPLRDIPVLIVWGMKDSAFPPAQLDRWTALLPSASVVRLAGAGHWPHEEEADSVIHAIYRWLGLR